MIRLLFDEDLNHHIIRGLVRRLPDLDYKSVLDLGLLGASDDDVLVAASKEKRLLVSHDANTMTAAFGRLLDRGDANCGLLLVPQSLPIGQAIAGLQLICAATDVEDWIGVMEFLPL